MAKRVTEDSLTDPTGFIRLLLESQQQNERVIFALEKITNEAG